MKSAAILSILLFSIQLSFSQEANSTGPSQQIGITISSFGETDLIRFKSLDGSASNEGKSFFTLGLNYLIPINEFLFLETGVDYSKHTIITIPNSPPNVDVLPSERELSIINIPVTVRAKFLQYFFLNGGLLVEMDISNNSTFDSQSGIGVLLGLGMNYDFDFGASVFMNPYIKGHSLVTFSREQYAQRLMETGIRMGVAFSF